MQKIFRYQNFSETPKDPLRKFSAMWDKVFPIEISDMPFLSLRFFGTRFFWNTEGFPYENFR